MGPGMENQGAKHWRAGTTQSDEDGCASYDPLSPTISHSSFEASNYDQDSDSDSDYNDMPPPLVARYESDSDDDSFSDPPPPMTQEMASSSDDDDVSSDESVSS